MECLLRPSVTLMLGLLSYNFHCCYRNRGCTDLLEGEYCRHRSVKMEAGESVAHSAHFPVYMRHEKLNCDTNTAQHR
jgi:hypothetical protein